jgi:hypothetical protein
MDFMIINGRMVLDILMGFRFWTGATCMGFAMGRATAAGAPAGLGTWG